MKSYELLKKELTTFCTENIMGKYESVIAGVSGGADSVCMLILLDEFCKKYGIRLVCAHFNHGIRGKEADEDQEFVRNLCLERNIIYECKKANVPEFAAANKISEEMAGRQLRYEFFEELSEREGCKTAVAVAHNKNDRIETVFLNIARGTGIQGLRGIQKINGNIVRPILSFSREETELVCRLNGIEFRKDKTNCENIYKRNIVRNIILPETDKYFNNFGEKLLSLSEIAEKEDEYLSEVSGTAYGSCVSETDGYYEIDKKKFSEIHPVIQNRVVRKIMSEIRDENGLIFPECCGFDRQNTEKTIKFIAEGETNKRIKLPKNVVCESRYGIVRIFLQKHKAEEKKLPERKAVSVAELLEKKSISVSYDGEDYVFEIREKEDLRNESKNQREAAVFDGDKILKAASEIKEQMIVRKPETGDIFRPFGAPGSKQLRRFFTDIKVPAEKRSEVTLVAFNGEILWIPGIRRGNNFTVDKNTKCVIIISRVH